MREMAANTGRIHLSGSFSYIHQVTPICIPPNAWFLHPNCLDGLNRGSSEFEVVEGDEGDGCHGG